MKQRQRRLSRVRSTMLCGEASASEATNFFFEFKGIRGIVIHVVSAA